MPMIKNALLVSAGLLLLALGAIGLLIPIWPTTPFVLLSAACLSCSPGLRAGIMRVPFFREHIENYQTRKGLSRKTVWISLGYLWGTLTLTMLLNPKAWLVALLMAVGGSVTGHILWMSRRRG